MDAKDYAYEIVAQLGYGGKLDERITTVTAQQIIETALDNYAKLRLSNVVGRSEQLKALLERLLKENMCSVVGDELIKEALKGF
jgi:hypothetical protein